MRIRRVPISLTLMLLLTTSGICQRVNVSTASPQKAQAFIEVKGLPDEIEPSYFEFSASGYDYRISKSGRGKRTGGGSPAINFNLRLRRGDHLDNELYYSEYQGDILFICGTTDGDSGAGFITRLDGRTLKPKWKRIIPSFNVGQGLIEEQHVYLTAIGFIGKLNLESGAYVWRHDNLYRSGVYYYRNGGAYNAFELPKIEGQTVVFLEIAVYPGIAKAIKVHKMSGKILSIGG